MQELYGDETAALLTGAFGRLFTAFLQMRGFTCGIDDLLLRGPAEQQRAAALGKAETAALQASAKVAGDEHSETVRVACSCPELPPLFPACLHASSSVRSGCLCLAPECWEGSVLCPPVGPCSCQECRHRHAHPLSYLDDRFSSAGCLLLCLAERARPLAFTHPLLLACSCCFRLPPGKQCLLHQALSSCTAALQADAEDSRRQRAVRTALAEKYRTSKLAGVVHDLGCVSALNPLSSEVVKVCKHWLRATPIAGAAFMTIKQACSVRHAFASADREICSAC